MNLHEYGGMLFRSARLEAFRSVLERVVGPSTRVLDLGTGLGTYAMLAARSGAARVVALDSHRVVHLARDLAVSNGLAERIEFVRATAPDGIPEGPYDLIVFEDYPTTLLDEPSWHLLRGIEARHLAPGGTMFPGAFRLTLAPVTDSAWVPTGPEETGAEGGRFLGLDWTELGRHLASSGRKVHLPPDALAAATPPGAWHDVLPTPGVDALAVEAEWPSNGAPIVGMALWFDLRLADDVVVSNRPALPGEPWGQWLLPVDPPLSAPVGATIRGSVWREARGDGVPGWMGWSCTSGGISRRGHEFKGLPLSLEDLRGDTGASEPAG